MRTAFLIAVGIGLVALVFMAAGAISWAANTNFDLTAGKGADARGEGEKAVLLAQAEEIAASTNRQNETAVIEREHLQTLNAQNETSRAQTIAMWATWKTVGAYTGGSFLIITAFVGAYFFAYRAWLVNDRLKRAPVLASNGPVVVVALPEGGVVFTNTANGFHFTVGHDGKAASIGPSDHVMVSTALANAYREALLSQGFSRPQAAQILSSLRAIVENRNSGPATILPAVIEH